MDLKQGDLENIILNAVWDLEGNTEENIYVGNVQEKIKTPVKKWAYTTVKTVLDRLVDKELALRVKDGKKYLYQSVVKRDEAGVIAVEKLIRQYFKNDVNELIDCLLSIKEAGASERAGSTENNVQATVEQVRALKQLRETQSLVAQ